VGASERFTAAYSYVRFTSRAIESNRPVRADIAIWQIVRFEA